MAEEHKTPQHGQVRDSEDLGHDGRCGGYGGQPQQAHDTRKHIHAQRRQGCEHENSDRDRPGDGAHRRGGRPVRGVVAVEGDMDGDNDGDCDSEADALGEPEPEGDDVCDKVGTDDALEVGSALKLALAEALLEADPELVGDDSAVPDAVTLELANADGDVVADALADGETLRLVLRPLSDEASTRPGTRRRVCCIQRP